ncbi:MAG: hypothetical protein D6732_20845 [Methanobacteriota archaeon]|nr:MAG: hypothetical protein D6732_20845 [Euryarchaeota archaeon]
MSLNDVGLAVVVNLESSGPTYITDTGLEFMDPASEMMFASRVVILCGMANHRTPQLQLQGPVPVSEIQDNNLEFYFFQIRPEDPELVNLHIIIVVFFPIEWKAIMRQLEVQLENRIREFARKIDYSHITPTSVDDHFKVMAETELRKIRDFLIEMLPKVPRGEKSLFNLSFLVTLPEEIKKAGKFLMLNPTGVKREDFNFDDEILKDLVRYGLVKIENRNGEEMIVPL